jgi:hypothetical protein
VTVAAKKEAGGNTAVRLVPVELLEARVNEYRLELAKREMQLVRYRLALEAHGIDPPDAEGADLVEMWRDCRAVISTASEFTMRLGTAKELLVDWGTK